MKVAEEQARKKARKLARTLGDQEWKNGRINNAMEAYEASDITSHELYENADRLMKAIELLPKTKDPSVLNRRVFERAWFETREKIHQLTGSAILASFSLGSIRAGYTGHEDLCAATIACLKTIRRMEVNEIF